MFTIPFRGQHDRTVILTVIGFFIIMISYHSRIFNSIYVKNSPNSNLYWEYAVCLKAPEFKSLRAGGYTIKNAVVFAIWHTRQH